MSAPTRTRGAWSSPARIRAAGFTLVELAVVLTVVTILLAMVLKSSSISDSAKANDVIAIAGDLSEAARQFREKFKYLPGDDPRANLDVGVANNLVGNGNGVIDFDPFTGSESQMAAFHLAQAGLVRVSADPNNLVTGVSLTSHYGAVWLMSFQSAFSPGLGGGPALCGTAVQGAASPPTALNAIVFQNIPAAVAQQIDAKYDDGVPATGSIRASGQAPYDTKYDTSPNAAPIACFAMPL